MEPLDCSTSSSGKTVSSLTMLSYKITIVSLTDPRAMWWCYI